MLIILVYAITDYKGVCRTMYIHWYESYLLLRLY